MLLRASWAELFTVFVKNSAQDASTRGIGPSWSRTIAHERRELHWNVRTARGAFSADRPLGVSDDSAGTGGASVAVGPHGVVVATWARPLQPGPVGRPMVAAILRSGARAFSRPAVLDAGHPHFGAPVAIGGAAIGVEYSDGLPTLIRRTRRGTWSAPIPLTRRRNSAEGPVLFGRNGGVVAMSMLSVASDTDCSELLHAQADSQGLAPGSTRVGRPRRLSAPGQLTEFAAGVRLPDDRILAVWSDVAGGAGPLSLRLEYAIGDRTGVFPPGSPLPELASFQPSLAAGGGHAALVWPAGPPDGPQQVMLSALAYAPPLAPVELRPLHPASGCT